MQEFDLIAADGLPLHCYDVGSSGRSDELVVVWLAGSPNIGEPPEPLFAAAERLHLRWVGYDRPGYGESPRRPAPSTAQAAEHVALLAHHLGARRCAVVGHSGGGPRALACAALLPDLVTAAVAMSTPAPLATATGLDYFAGMRPSVVRELQAAVEGPAPLEAVLTADERDPAVFTSRDLAALDGEWGWFHRIVAAATADGVGGFVDDDLSLVRDWGFPLGRSKVPTLLVHGAADQMIPATHTTWLHTRLPGSQLTVVPEEGHISVLPAAAADALQWIRARADRTAPA